MSNKPIFRGPSEFSENTMAKEFEKFEFHNYELKDKIIEVLFIGSRTAYINAGNSYKYQCDRDHIWRYRHGITAAGFAYMKNQNNLRKNSPPLDWDLGPTNTELIDQLTSLIADNQPDNKDSELLQLIVERFDRMNELLHDFVQLTKNNETTNNQLKLLVKYGFNRHELVREYGYAKGRSAIAEQKYSN